jgi:glycosyltransferase involved in cell wall biosynthesis
MYLSVIVPIKDEHDNLQPLAVCLLQTMETLGLQYEIIFVDDGSSDDSYQVLAGIASGDSRIRILRLWRSFGQAVALRAGIDSSSGDVVVTLDGDLQNDPADIPLMLEKLAEGVDAVMGVREHRRDNYLFRTVPSLLGNWLIRIVTEVTVRDIGCALRVMRRELAAALPLYGEMHRYIPVIAQQYGANVTQIPVRHHPRRAGKSKYTLFRAIRTVLDLITLQFFHSYFTRPMHVMGLAGLLCMGLGALSLGATMWMKWETGIFMTGNPLLLLSVMLELIGVQLISTGLLAEVMVRTYFESQGKTAYAIRSTVNFKQ